MKHLNKIALVTGANRGIGFAIAKGLLQKGLTVIATSRSEANGKTSIEQLSSYGDLRYCQLDVTRLESIHACVDFVDTEFGRLDALINNAGINYDTWHNALNANLEEVRTTFETNMYGPWQLIQALLPLLQKSDHGANIVNVSSGAGALDAQTGGTPGYSLSKLALNGLTLQLANQLQSYNIRVNAVCPGWVRTDMGGSSATKSPEEGADTIIWAALSDSHGPTGKFFRNRTEIAY
ncbi:SDR family oxidoreductase [Winogradskyella sp.]|uniref:SDR family oxidoreductase n=1 Tax=Winogradskyella sp. TaxID=1883156 RepID=UPI003BAB86BF